MSRVKAGAVAGDFLNDQANRFCRRMFDAAGSEQAALAIAREVVFRFELTHRVNLLEQIDAHTKAEQIAHATTDAEKPSTSPNDDTTMRGGQ